MGFKSGFISVVGRPNVGKSTLNNRITGEKVSIVTPKPQTTRKNIKAIYTDKECQMIFLDTPGIHMPHNKLGQYMVESAKSAFSETDLILFITAPKRSGVIPDEDKIIIELLKEVKLPRICVINKCDTISQEVVAEYITMYSEQLEFDEIVPISAENGKNVDMLKDIVKKYLSEGPMYYDEDEMTDQTEREIAGEIIREKMLFLLQEEVPHCAAVEVESFKQREDKELLDISAVIYCDKNSHKGIIIGKNGDMLKRIGTEARKSMEHALQMKVNLKLWVKVKEDWRNDNNVLGTLGYKKQK
ncbi:MAG: GTPase Era [Clostridia bacterium]